MWKCSTAETCEVRQWPSHHTNLVNKKELSGSGPMSHAHRDMGHGLWPHSSSLVHMGWASCLPWGGSAWRCYTLYANTQKPTPVFTILWLWPCLSSSDILVTQRGISLNTGSLCCFSPFHPGFLFVHADQGALWTVRSCCHWRFSAVLFYIRPKAALVKVCLSSPLQGMSAGQGFGLFVLGNNSNFCCYGMILNSGWEEGDICCIKGRWICSEAPLCPEAALCWQKHSQDVPLNPCPQAEKWELTAAGAVLRSPYIWGSNLER